MIVNLSLLLGCAKDNIVLVDSIEFDDSEDYVANTMFAQTISVVFSTDGNATVTGDSEDFSVTISGNDVTIVYSGEEYVMYELSGTAADGFFKLYSAKKQGITLNGVSITNPNGAAINVQGPQAEPNKGQRTFIVMKGDNSLADGTSYTDTPDDEDEKAVLFGEGQFIFSGTGSLTVKARGKAGVASDEYIRIIEGILDINATTGKGIKSKGDLYIKGGKIVVNCIANEGIEAKGTLSISDGEVYSYSQSDDAINSGGNLTISGGLVCAYSQGNDGLDANGNCYIKGGVVYAIGATSPEVAVDANSEGGYKLYLTGGTLVAIGGLESGSSLTQSCYSASSWSQNTWYGLTVGSTTYAFKTPSSGGTPLVVSGSSTPTLQSGISISGGTACFEEMFYTDASFNGGSSVSLSSYSGGNGGGGGPGGGGHGPF